jgi:hypothetical protein
MNTSRPKHRQLGLVANASCSGIYAVLSQPQALREEPLSEAARDPLSSRDATLVSRLRRAASARPSRMRLAHDAATDR